MRQDYRLFKLNRMVDLECCQEVFDKRILPLMKMRRTVLPYPFSGKGTVQTVH